MTGRRFVVPATFLALGLLCVALGFVGAIARAATQRSVEAEDPRAEVYSAEASLIAEGEANRGAAESDAPGPPRYSPDPWPEGIAGDDPFSPGTPYDISNIWRHVEKDAYVAVWAGQHADNPAEAVVFVYRLDPSNGATTLDGPLGVPIEGPIKIIGEHGDTVTLAGPAETVEFTAASGSFGAPTPVAGSR